MYILNEWLHAKFVLNLSHKLYFEFNYQYGIPSEDFIDDTGKRLVI